MTISRNDNNSLNIPSWFVTIIVTVLLAIFSMSIFNAKQTGETKSTLTSLDQRLNRIERQLDQHLLIN